jgi:hypothetical protein
MSSRYEVVRYDISSIRSSVMKSTSSAWLVFETNIQNPFQTEKNPHEQNRNKRMRQRSVSSLHAMLCYPSCIMFCCLSKTLLFIQYKSWLRREVALKQFFGKCFKVLWRSIFVAFSVMFSMLHVPLLPQCHWSFVSLPSSLVIRKRNPSYTISPKGNNNSHFEMSFYKLSTRM